MGVPVDLSSVAASGSSPLGVPIGIAAGFNTLGSLLGGALTQGYNRENMALQNEYAKDLMNYQWQNFGSYEAQVKSMQKAGLNPAVLFGKGSSSAASPSPVMPSSAPINVPSVFDLSSLSNYMLSVAQAKKAGMDTKLSEQDIKNKEVVRQRNEFEFDLRKQFGKDFNTADLANAYMKLVLAADSADLNEQEKALNVWKIAGEKAESESKEFNRDILKQMLDNNPTKIALENNLASEKIKTEKASQAASYASAEQSRTQSDINREVRRLQSALADVEENTKLSRIESLIAEYSAKGLISDADAKEAYLRASRINSVENRRDNSTLFKAVDDFSEWLKSKVKIFGK